MKVYKQDQGRMARMAAFWSLALLLLFGCVTLHTTLSGLVDSLAERIWDGGRIPIVGVEVTGAFLISSGLFLAGMWVLWRWTQRPKVADLLIETESELRKVTWPTPEAVVNASLVVVALVLVLMAFLAGADWALGRLMARILLGAQ
jgi:preprotein translocase SecE subunit